MSILFTAVFAASRRVQVPSKYLVSEYLAFRPHFLPVSPLLSPRANRAEPALLLRSHFLLCHGLRMCCFLGLENSFPACSAFPSYSGLAWEAFPDLIPQIWHLSYVPQSTRQPPQLEQLLFIESKVWVLSKFSDIISFILPH